MKYLLLLPIITLLICAGCKSTTNPVTRYDDLPKKEPTTALWQKSF